MSWSRLGLCRVRQGAVVVVDLMVALWVAHLEMSVWEVHSVVDDIARICPWR